jgi:hypothetical protein
MSGLRPNSAARELGGLGASGLDASFQRHVMVLVGTDSMFQLGCFSRQHRAEESKQFLCNRAPLSLKPGEHIQIRVRSSVLAPAQIAAGPGFEAVLV